MIKFAGLFRADARKAAKYWGVEAHVNNARSREVLGINYRTCNESLKDMGHSMLDLGLIRDRRPKH